MRKYCVLLLIMIVTIANAKSGLHFKVDNAEMDFNKTDIISITPVTTTLSNKMVLIHLKESAARRLHLLTQQAKGHVATFSWNGRVVQMIQLDNPLENDICITGFRPNEIQQLVFN